MKNNVYCVSCDWLELAGYTAWVMEEMVMPQSSPLNTPSEARREAASLPKYREPLGEIFEADGLRFKCVPSEQTSPAYLFSHALTYRGSIVCHIFWLPRQSCVDRRSAHLKIDNQTLYCSEWPRMLSTIMRAIGFSFLRLSRVDIAADFEYFANGRLPLRFVQDYLSKPTASRPSFIRKSSNKFRAFGEKTTLSVLYSTLSWGTRDSAVQVNLYNKTVELQQHADKPWIRDKWRSVGLPADFEKGRYVWRVEFSLNCSTKFIRDGKLGFVREILLADVESQGRLNDMFAALLPQFFQFKYLTKTDVNKHRKVKDLQDVILFADVDAAPYQFRSFVAGYKSAGRFEKMMFHKLTELYNREDLTTKEIGSISDVLYMLAKIFGDKQAVTAGRISESDLLRSFLLHVGHDKRPRGMTPERKYREVTRIVSMLLGEHKDLASDMHSSFVEWDANMTYLQSKVHELLDFLPDNFVEDL